jgi:hypothetical protein
MNMDCKNITKLYENAKQQPILDILPNGTKMWWLHGVWHNENEPAVVYPNGTEEWYLHGKLHNANGPAVKSLLGSSWYLHGKVHREDGPAVERADGYNSWWLNNKKYKDAFAWAEALLKLKGINDPSEDEINDKVQQVTSASILD